MKNTFYISTQQLEILIGSGDGKVQDLTNDQGSQVREFLGVGQTLAVISSGVKGPYSVSMQVAGLERLRLEDKPKRGEPPINVDRFPVFATADPQIFKVEKAAIKCVNWTFKHWEESPEAVIDRCLTLFKNH